MKPYEKPELKVQAIATNERLMANECESEEVVARWKDGVGEGFGIMMVCVYTQKDS